MPGGSSSHKHYQNENKIRGTRSNLGDQEDHCPFPSCQGDQVVTNIIKTKIRSEEYKTKIRSRNLFLIFLSKLCSGYIGIFIINKIIELIHSLQHLRITAKEHKIKEDHYEK